MGWEKGRKTIYKVLWDLHPGEKMVFWDKIKTMRLKVLRNRTPNLVQIGPVVVENGHANRKTDGRPNGREIPIMHFIWKYAKMN